MSLNKELRGCRPFVADGNDVLGLGDGNKIQVIKRIISLKAEKHEDSYYSSRDFTGNGASKIILLFFWLLF